MITFLIIAGVMLLLSVAIVLWPLWRAAPVAGSRREANIAVYEQHTAEIERERQAGRMTPAQANARHEELGARLLDDVESRPPLAGHESGSRPWLTSSLVIVGVAALAIGLYSVLGDLRGLTLQTRPDIAELVAKMKSRLAEVPGDLQTRALLAQVQMAQHKYAAAARTLAGINARLEQPDAAMLLAEARARVLASNGVVKQRAQALYDRILQLIPHNTEALWFAGLAALADGDEQRAIERWQTLLQQEIPKDFRARVERRLAELSGAAPSLESEN